MSWQKPFFIDITNLTFDTLKKLVKILNCEESKESLKNTLKILSAHLGILSSGSGHNQPGHLWPDILTDDKKELETLLYDLVDSPSCSQDILMALISCLQEGMNLLLPPLHQRIIIANDLLNLEPNSIKKSQKIKLRLILQSINDPKTIGQLMQYCHDQEDVIQDVIDLLETLLLKDSQSLIKSLTSGETHAGLPSEERGLLFTIHTQFVLFNLNISPKKFMLNFNLVKEMVLKYLKTLFEVSQEILDTARMAMKNPIDGENKTILNCCHENSAILNVLHLSLIALIQSSSSVSLEILEDVRKICKSGLQLQKLVLEDSETWLFLFHLNALSSTFLTTLLNSMINDGHTGTNSAPEQNIHTALKKLRKSDILVKKCDIQIVEKEGKLL